MTTAGLEIERKFLLTAIPDAVSSLPGVAIQQGYLAVDGDVEVRVRRAGERYLLTIKGGAGLVRREEEIELDDRRFAALWSLTDGRRLEKRRTTFALGEVVVEVDEYDGDLHGLIVAEVEFSSVTASSTFVPPEWFGREVTGDPRYANRALAADGVPPVP